MDQIFVLDEIGLLIWTKKGGFVVHKGQILKKKKS